MRILWCHSHFGDGGGPVTILSWAKGLRRLGCRIEFIGEGGRLEPTVRSEGFALRVLDVCRRLSVMTSLSYAKRAKRMQADVLIGVGNVAGMTAALSAYWVRKPFLLIYNLTPRTLMWEGNDRWRFPRLSPMVVVNKKFGEMCVSKYGWPAHLIKYIPQRIDLAPFADLTSLVAKDKGRVLVMRRLDPIKGEGVVNFLSRIRETLCVTKEVGVTIAGDGAARGKIEDVARQINHQSGREAVHCIGYADNVIRLFQTHAVVVGSERCAIEAIAAGKPTFVLANSGKTWQVFSDRLPFLAEDNFLGAHLAERGVEPEETDVICRTALGEDQSEDRMACRKWVFEHYDARQGSEILYNILSDLVHKGDGPSGFGEYLKALFSMYRVLGRDSIMRRLALRYAK